MKRTMNSGTRQESIPTCWLCSNILPRADNLSDICAISSSALRFATPLRLDGRCWPTLVCDRYQKQPSGCVSIDHGGLRKSRTRVTQSCRERLPTTVRAPGIVTTYRDLLTKNALVLRTAPLRGCQRATGSLDNREVLFLGLLKSIAVVEVLHAAHGAVVVLERVDAVLVILPHGLCRRGLGQGALDRLGLLRLSTKAVGQPKAI